MGILESFRLQEVGMRGRHLRIQNSMPDGFRYVKARWKSSSYYLAVVCAGQLRRVPPPALCISLAACAVGPDFVPPSAPVADKFVGANGSSVKSSGNEVWSWWKSFQDPTLTKLIDIAYNQNLTLLSAGTKVLQGRAALGIAIGEFYPQQQQATGSLLYNRTSAATPTALARAKPRYFWTDTLALQASWELDFWRKFRRGVESADAAYLASIASYDNVLVSLLGDVAATYIGIRITEKLITIAEDNVRKQKKALSIAQAKFQGGGTSEQDVFQATNVLEQTQAAIPQLLIQLQQGQSALAVLMGMPPQPLNALLARSRGQIPLPPGKIAVGIPADLLCRRPDIRAAEFSALAQSAQIGVAEAQPIQLSPLPAPLVAQRVPPTHNLGDVFNWKGMTFTGGPTFQWNILNYGQITNNVGLQDATLQQLLVDYQNTVLKAQQEVTNGLSTFVQSRVEAGHLRESAKAARGALDVSLLQYEQGALDFTTVLVSEQNFFQAESSLAVAAGNVALGAVATYRALGGGWQIREDSAFVTVAVAEEMRARTNWGALLAPADEPQPPAPGLPSPADIGPTVRPPEW